MQAAIAAKLNVNWSGSNDLLGVKVSEQAKRFFGSGRMSEWMIDIVWN